MNYLGASPRGIKKANAHGESGTDPRVGVLTKKRIKFLKAVSRYYQIVDDSH